MQYRDWSNVIKDMHSGTTFTVAKLRKMDSTPTTPTPTPNSLTSQVDPLTPSDSFKNKNSEPPKSNETVHNGGHSDEEGRGEKINLPKVEGYSLGIFSPTNPLRIFLTRVVNSPKFEQFIIALIIISSVVLALDEPRLDEDSVLFKIIVVLDYIFVYTFLLECIIKVVVYGFVINKGSYLRNGWNILDFIIVIVGLISIHSDGGQVDGLRALRTLRALRPIRMASRAEGMKVVVNALFQAIPGCGNVALVCGLFYLIFGILGVNLFKGMFQYCEGCPCEVNSDGSIGQCDYQSCSRLEPDMVIKGNSFSKATSLMTEGWCNIGVHLVDFGYKAGYFQRNVDFVNLANSTSSDNGNPYYLRTS